MKPLLGVAFNLAASFVFSWMIVIVKIAGETVPVGQVAFCRNFFALVPVLAYLAWRGQLSSLKTSKPMGHLGRSLVGVIAMLLWFSALTRLPIADATAISFAAPLLTTALAAVMLGEVVRFYRWSAVGVGLVGVLVMLWPHLGAFERGFGDQEALGAAMAITAAFFIALATIFMRALTKTESTGAIVFYFSVGATVVSGLTVFAGWVWPSPREAALLVGAGLIGGVGQILLTQSFKYADASMLAPMSYMALVWAVILGFVLFGELPSTEIYIGAAIVIAAGVFITLREHRLGLKRPEKPLKAPVPEA